MAMLASMLLASAARADVKKAAPTTCPDPVKASVAKGYPDAAIASCKHEHEDGREQYEVKLTRKDGARLELDVSPDGKILQAEEKVELAAVPTAVMKAFSAKYPKAKASRAEKETRADGGVFYELAFQGDHGRKEATFKADGSFAEEE